MHIDKEYILLCLKLCAADLFYLRNRESATAINVITQYSNYWNLSWTLTICQFHFITSSGGTTYK